MDKYNMSKVLNSSRNIGFNDDYLYYDGELPLFELGESSIDGNTIVTSREIVLFITLTCCIGPLNLLGMVTNALTVAVFQRYPTRGSTTFFLQILSVADSIFLFNNILYLSVQYYFAFIGRYFDYYKLYGQFLPFLKGFTELSRDYGVWCVVLITVDRFLGICYPLNSPKYCDVQKAKIASCVVLVYCVLFNIPEFLFSKVQNSVGYYEVVPTELGNNFTFNVCYFTFDVLLNLLLPVVVVLYMNIRICWELILARRHRFAMARGNLPRHSKMTTTLITVAVFFLICQVPRIVATIYNCQALYSQLYEKDHSIMSESVPFVLYAISNILQNCNALGNFYIYCITGKQFRTLLWAVCTCKHPPRRSSYSTEQTRRFSLPTSTFRKISS